LVQIIANRKLHQNKVVASAEFSSNAFREIDVGGGFPSFRIRNRMFLHLNKLDSKEFNWVLRQDDGKRQKDTKLKVLITRLKSAQRLEIPETNVIKSPSPSSGTTDRDQSDLLSPPGIVPSISSDGNASISSRITKDTLHDLDRRLPSPASFRSIDERSDQLETAVEQTSDQMKAWEPLLDKAQVFVDLVNGIAEVCGLLYQKDAID
jgi:hypothetical protein